jgi:surface protein
MHAACAATPTPSRLPVHTPRPASRALLSTRQGASAFNQLVSFDTSKVTDMHGMFSVRPARALAPKP